MNIHPRLYNSSYNVNTKLTATNSRLSDFVHKSVGPNRCHAALCCDYMSHGDVFTIPILVDEIQYRIRHFFCKIFEIFLVKYGDFRQHDGVIAAPPCVLPPQILRRAYLLCHVICYTLYFIINENR